MTSNLVINSNQDFDQLVKNICDNNIQQDPNEVFKNLDLFEEDKDEAIEKKSNFKQ